MKGCTLLLRVLLLTALCLVLFLSMSSTVLAKDKCEITRIAPAKAEIWRLELGEKSLVPLRKGINVLSISCSLAEGGVLTFQRPGLETYKWIQNGVEKRPIPAGQIAYALDQGTFTALITIGSKLQYIPRFKLYSKEDFLISSQKHNLIMGMFYGMGVTLVLLSFSVGWKIRGNAFKLYGAYILCLTSFFLLQEGQLFIFFGEGASDVLNIAYLLSIGLVVVSATWFLLSFLYINKDFPRLNMAISAVSLLVLWMTILRTVFSYEVFLSISGIVMGYGTLTIIFALFSLSIIQACRGVREAGLVCIALSFILLSMIFRIVLLNYSPFMQRYGFILAFSVEAILLAIALSRRISRISIAKDKAEKDATVDPLCGIANRRGFTNKLSELIETNSDNTMLFAAFYIDIDDFKMVNDNFGHRAGDIALQRIADCLVKNMRTEDAVGRLGGDEFIAVASFKNNAEASKKHAELKQAFEAISFTSGDVKLTLTASVGCAFFEQLPMNLEEIIAASDSSMYAEKGKKKNN